MKIAKASYEILYAPDKDIVEKLERIARVSHKSENMMTGDLIKKCIEMGHLSVLEHSYISVLFICDRATSHELVRHRLMSFTQESQRYCNYSKDRFGNNVTFIQPWWMDEEDDIGYSIWRKSCKDAEKAYFDLLHVGYAPQRARMVLPNCTKTEVIATANFREWRHVLDIRTKIDAHPDIRHLMKGLLKDLNERFPDIFGDIAKE